MTHDADDLVHDALDTLVNNDTTVGRALLAPLSVIDIGGHTYHGFPALNANQICHYWVLAHQLLHIISTVLLFKPRQSSQNGEMQSSMLCAHIHQPSHLKTSWKLVVFLQLAGPRCHILRVPARTTSFYIDSHNSAHTEMNRESRAQWHNGCARLQQICAALFGQ